MHEVYRKHFSMVLLCTCRYLSGINHKYCFVNLSALQIEEPIGNEQAGYIKTEQSWIIFRNILDTKIVNWMSLRRTKKINLSSQVLKTIICNHQGSNSVSEWENKKASC